MLLGFFRDRLGFCWVCDRSATVQQPDQGSHPRGIWAPVQEVREVRKFPKKLKGVYILKSWSFWSSVVY